MRRGKKKKRTSLRWDELTPTRREARGIRIVSFLSHILSMLHRGRIRATPRSQIGSQSAYPARHAIQGALPAPVHLGDHPLYFIRRWKVTVSLSAYPHSMYMRVPGRPDLAPCPRCRLPCLLLVPTVSQAQLQMGSIHRGELAVILASITGNDHRTILSPHTVRQASRLHARKTASCIVWVLSSRGTRIDVFCECMRSTSSCVA